jgi:hypothetical protein
LAPRLFELLFEKSEKAGTAGYIIIADFALTEGAAERRRSRGGLLPSPQEHPSQDFRFDCDNSSLSHLLGGV